MEKMSWQAAASAIWEAEARGGTPALVDAHIESPDGCVVMPVTVACALGCPRVALALLRGGCVIDYFTRSSAAFAGLEGVVRVLPANDVHLHVFYDRFGGLRNGTRAGLLAAVLACERWGGFRRAWIAAVTGGRHGAAVV